MWAWEHWPYRPIIVPRWHPLPSAWTTILARLIDKARVQAVTATKVVQPSVHPSRKIQLPFVLVTLLFALVHIVLAILNKRSHSYRTISLINIYAINFNICAKFFYLLWRELWPSSRRIPNDRPWGEHILPIILAASLLRQRAFLFFRMINRLVPKWILRLESSIARRSTRKVRSKILPVG